MASKFNKILKSPSEGDVCHCTVYLDHNHLFLTDGGGNKKTEGDLGRAKKHSATESILSRNSVFSRGYYSQARRFSSEDEDRYFVILFIFEILFNCIFLRFINSTNVA